MDVTRDWALEPSHGSLPPSHEFFISRPPLPTPAPPHIHNMFKHPLRRPAGIPCPTAIPTPRHPPPGPLLCMPDRHLPRLLPWPSPFIFLLIQQRHSGRIPILVGERDTPRPTAVGTHAAPQERKEDRDSGTSSGDRVLRPPRRARRCHDR